MKRRMGEKMKKEKIRKFTVVFEKAKEGGYVVSVPILPGCVSQGETFEEAERMIKDAIKCYCESLIKHDEPIPKESEEIFGLVDVPVRISA